MFGEAWPPMSVPDLAPDDDDESLSLSLSLSLSISLSLCPLSLFLFLSSLSLPFLFSLFLPSLFFLPPSLSLSLAFSLSPFSFFPLLSSLFFSPSLSFSLPFSLSLPHFLFLSTPLSLTYVDSCSCPSVCLSSVIILHATVLLSPSLLPPPPTQLHTHISYPSYVSMALPEHVWQSSKFELLLTPTDMNPRIPDAARMLSRALLVFHWPHTLITAGHSLAEIEVWGKRRGGGLVFSFS